MVRLTPIAALLLVACKSNEPPAADKPPSIAPAVVKPGATVARGTIRRKSVETSYAVAVARGSDVVAIEKLARQKGPTLDVTRTTLASLLDEERLAFLTKDLAPADAEGLKGSPAVILLNGSGRDAMELARDIAAVTRDVADAAHGWVFDPDTFRLHTAAAFREHVPGEHPDARMLIVVHTIMGDGEQPFLDTAGLRRYGLPELYVPEASSGQINQIGHLINGAAQVLLDGGDVDEHGAIAVEFKRLGWDMDILAGGSGKAVWRTRWRENGEAEDAPLVVELVPPAGAGAEGASRLVADCFGRHDEVTMLRDDDPALLAAAAKARADLATLRSYFAKGVPLDESLTVKAKFTDDEGNVEWMWVDVVRFKSDTFSGTLANEPELVHSVRPGQKVKVKLADVGDYLHGKKDGTRVGGYSIEVMKKRGLLPADP